MPTRASISGSRSWTRERLLEDSEVAEQPPENQKDENGAEAASAQFLRAVTGCEPTKKFAHGAAASGKWRAHAVGNWNGEHFPFPTVVVALFPIPCFHCIDSTLWYQPWAKATSAARRARFIAARTGNAGHARNAGRRQRPRGPSS